MKKYAWLLILFVACKSTKNEHQAEIKDPHSFASLSSSRVEHLYLDIEVNMDEKVIEGTATYTLAEAGLTDTIYFDTKNMLIERVYETASNQDLKYNQDKKDKILGDALMVILNKDVNKISIDYKTTSDAIALQWLNPSQTAGKTEPYLYTQSQAILARSWIPCQDGPGIRFTYDARVKVPKNLLALMSAENPTERNDSGIYHFKQTRAIPSYLMALVVGDIKFKSLGDRCGVYTESSELERCANEFADLPKMIATAESLYGKYQWNRYDILVLPPSFPFGGMENPELTFATPTIITGDRSLVNLISHELAHSWSGNLVTNSTWNDIWLNEGFTVYFERRITEKLEGKDYVEMLEILGYQDLIAEIKSIGATSNDTRLALSLEGRDPDEGLSDIAYEKGALFLKHIEGIVGRESFDAFLNGYFKENAFKTIDTKKFIAYLNEHLIKSDSSIAKKINLNAWIYQPGLPTEIPALKSSRLEIVNAALISFQKNTSIDTAISNKWSSHEWLYFIRGLGDQINIDQMNYLNKNIDFANSGNAELEAAWFVHVIKNKYSDDYPEMKKFLLSVGRRKFLMPLYSEMIKTTEGKKMAKSIYAEARQNYHYVSVQSIDKLLN